MTATSLIAAAPSPASADVLGADYYVNCSGGSDGNPGTDSAPWATVAAISGRTFGPGSTIHLASSCVFPGDLVLHGAGTAVAPVTLTNYGRGGRPVVQSGGTAYNAVRMSDAYQVVENLKIVNARSGAVGIDGPYAIVRNLEVASSGEGVEVHNTGHHALIVGVYAHDLRMVVNDPGGDNDYGAVGFAVGADDVTITGNACLKCIARSYDYGFDGGFVEVFKHADNLVVNRNISYNVDGFIEVGGNSSSDHADNMTLHDNLVINTTTAVHINVNNSYGILARDLRFDNNTFVQLAPPLRSDFKVFYGTDVSSTIRNNIFYMYPGELIGTAPWRHTGNLYWQPAPARRLSYALGETEKWADPMMMNLVGADYRLAANSPARSLGQPVPYLLDFNSRSLSAQPDAGAMQYSP